MNAGQSRNAYIMLESAIFIFYRIGGTGRTVPRRQKQAGMM